MYRERERERERKTRVGEVKRRLPIKVKKKNPGDGATLESCWALGDTATHGGLVRDGLWG